jgi:hypothetical protein
MWHNYGPFHEVLHLKNNSMLKQFLKTLDNNIIATLILIIIILYKCWNFQKKMFFFPKAK